jgi:hypothetical protein
MADTPPPPSAFSIGPPWETATKRVEKRRTENDFAPGENAFSDYDKYPGTYFVEYRNTKTSKQNPKAGDEGQDSSSVESSLITRNKCEVINHEQPGNAYLKSSISNDQLQNIEEQLTMASPPPPRLTAFIPQRDRETTTEREEKRRTEDSLTFRENRRSPSAFDDGKIQSRRRRGFASAFIGFRNIRKFLRGKQTPTAGDEGQRLSASEFSRLDTNNCDSSDQVMTLPNKLAMYT